MRDGGAGDSPGLTDGFQSLRSAFSSRGSQGEEAEEEDLSEEEEEDGGGGSHRVQF